MPSAIPTSGRLAAALVFAVVATLAAAPSAAHAVAVYGGQARAFEPIVVTADVAAQVTQTLIVSYEATCDDGTTFPDARRLVVAGGGATSIGTPFTATENAGGRLAGQATGTVALAGDRQATFTIAMSGELSRGFATGTLDAQVTLTSAQGASVSCRTGALRWRAYRGRGYVYGGITSQSEPIVLRRRGLRVQSLRFGWSSAECTPADSIRLGESLSNFRIRGVAFGAVFSQSFALSSGPGTATYDYNVLGRIAKKIARGSFSVRRTETVDGQERSRCESGPVTWVATTG